MKKTFLIFAIVFGWASSAYGATSDPIPTLRAVAALTNAEASRHIPVSFEATIIYDFKPGADINVQDGDTAIFVRPVLDTGFVPGDRVRVEGTTEQSFLPFIANARITFLRHGTVPEPVEGRFDDLVRTRLNCRLVRVRGIVRTVDIVTAKTSPTGRLQLQMEGGYADIHLSNYDAAALKTSWTRRLRLPAPQGGFLTGRCGRRA